MVVDANCLIMSGAVVGDALAADFGPLPLAFLPVGGRRLYELQIARLKGAGSLHMVLPERFRLSEYDHARLAAHSVSIIRAPEAPSFGAAVQYALGALRPGDAPVHILAGDALFERMPAGEADIIVAAKPDGGAGRLALELAHDRIEAVDQDLWGDEEDERPIAAGYFAFESGADLLRALRRAGGDFAAGLNGYLTIHDVRMKAAAGWLDFSRAETYYASRCALTDAAPCRSREASLPTLAEVFVFGALGRRAWLSILESCRALLSPVAEFAGDGDAPPLCGVLEPLEAFARQSRFPIDRPLAYEGRPCPPLVEIAEQLDQQLRRAIPRWRPARGDWGFSDILYDARAGRVRPASRRGLANGDEGGDVRQSLASLAQSVVGRYDQILAGRYCVAEWGGDFSLGFETVPCQPWLAEALKDLSVDGVGGDDPAVKAATVSRFLSMIALHADRPDRQAAFVANALRLFLELD